MTIGLPLTGPFRLTCSAGALGSSKVSRCFFSHAYASKYNSCHLAGGAQIDPHLGSRQEIDKDQNSESEKLGPSLAHDLFLQRVSGQP